MLIKTLLNRIERFKSYVYEDTRLKRVGGILALVVLVLPRKNSKPICGVCGQKGSLYDTQEARLYEYVPLWGFQVFFVTRPGG